MGDNRILHFSYTNSTRKGNTYYDNKDQFLVFYNKNHQFEEHRCTVRRLLQYLFSLKIKVRWQLNKFLKFHAEHQ